MKYAVIFFFATGIFSLKAQNETDAIRYSQESVGSTARSFAVGGAFGAVGADPSCAAINPAGMAKFRTSKFYMSSELFNAKNRTVFLKEETTANKFNFNLPNVSLIVNIPGEDYLSKKPKGFVNYVFSFNINRLNNFHKKTVVDGINTTNSITQDWAERATKEGTTPDKFSRYTLEYLAYYGFMIDPDTSSPVPAYKSAYGNTPIRVSQVSSNQSRGALNDYSMSFAANYRHIVMAGISVGVKSVRYIEEISFVETDKKTTGEKDIKEAKLDKYLKTSGLGFNAKVGMIITPGEFIRIGLAYHTPAVLYLSDSYKYTLYSQFDYRAMDFNGNIRNNSINSTDDALYKYTITTPAREVISLAFLNKDMGFISLDAEFVNYGDASMFAKDYAFLSENRNINKNYNSVVNLRMGVEMIQEQYRFRAGYARYPSPYKKTLYPDLKALVNNIYTLGFGIVNEEFTFDIAYVNRGYTDYYIPYTLENNQHPTAQNSVRASSLVMTVGFNIE